VCLVQTRDKPIRAFSRWATLSYSWGGDQPHKTTRHNLERYVEAISLADMPQTIQDAVNVCRQLDISYIWIDSLCIVQGDSDDLSRELAQMPRIYQGSLVTIYAASARSVTEGFLQRRQFHYKKVPAHQAPVFRRPFTRGPGARISPTRRVGQLRQQLSNPRLIQDHQPARQAGVGLPGTHAIPANAHLLREGTLLAVRLGCSAFRARPTLAVAVSLRPAVPSGKGDARVDGCR
jgi:hypothetical protein